jgi:hypothetical protein
VIGAFTRWRGATGFVVEPARPADHPAITAIVAGHEGAAAAAIAARWLRRPEASAIVVRDGEAAPAGFELTVRLDQARPVDSAADPCARLAMRHVEANGGRRRGSSILLHRFLMSRDTYQAHSPIQSLLGSQVMRMYMTTPKLDWTFTWMSEPEQWAAQLEAAFGARLLPPVTLDGRRYGVFWHCFRDLSPAAWLAWLARRGIDDTAATPVPRVLDRHELDAAVRVAFQTLHRSGPLEDQRLLESPLLAGTNRVLDGRAAVRALLVDASQLLVTAPRGARLRTALHHAYLEPAPDQETGAKRAGMAFSTYRRNINTAIDLVVDQLWHRQRNGP